MIEVEKLKDKLNRCAGFIDWTSSYELEEHDGQYRRVMDIYYYDGTEYVAAKCEVTYRDEDICEQWCDALSFTIEKVIG